jgi:hypothetical protein
MLLISYFYIRLMKIFTYNKYIVNETGIKKYKKWGFDLK